MIVLRDIPFQQYAEHIIAANLPLQHSFQNMPLSFDLSVPDGNAKSL